MTEKAFPHRNSRRMQPAGVGLREQRYSRFMGGAVDTAAFFRPMDACFSLASLPETSKIERTNRMFATWTLGRRCRWAIVLSAMLVACGLGQRLKADPPEMGGSCPTVRIEIGNDNLDMRILSPRIIEVTFLRGGKRDEPTPMIDTTAQMDRRPAQSHSTACR